MENRMDVLFDELVPSMGMADTVAGELIRATGRLRYRFYNDGDKVLSGYGNETCNGSLRYITNKLEELVDSEDLNDEFNKLWNGNSMLDYEYEEQLEICVDKMVNYIDSNTNLRLMSNLADSVSDFEEQEDYDYDDYNDHDYADDDYADDVYGEYTYDDEY